MITEISFLEIITGYFAFYVYYIYAVLYQRHDITITLSNSKTLNYRVFS